MMAKRVMNNQPAPKIIRLTPNVEADFSDLCIVMIWVEWSLIT